ncbi:MAG: hypothetical protein A2V67_13975 [Deltaproteobacteria bacterium RBG_13_61_14]|nr:MAG: hypothetical protein A2V67_13975 [Deltaproteobacteria bacterium RBG_13_61_14]
MACRSVKNKVRGKARFQGETYSAETSGGFDALTIEGGFDRLTIEDEFDRLTTAGPFAPAAAIPKIRLIPMRLIMVFSLCRISGYPSRKLGGRQVMHIFIAQPFFIYHKKNNSSSINRCYK